MKQFVLDTNIIILLVRETSRERVADLIGLNDSENQFIISIVTVGELESFGLQNRWGDRKFATMYGILEDVVNVGLEYESIISEYAQIDAFSQRRHSSRLLNVSARNMGKNDLWIAATASALDVPLITADADFDHLNGEFLAVQRIEREELR